MQAFFKTMTNLKPAVVLLGLCFVLPSPAVAARPDERRQRPRISGIDHVTIYVSDANRSRQFYSRDLGLTTGCPQYIGPETCFFVGPANQRVLLKRAPTETKSRTLKNWLAEVGFRTDSVSKMRHYLLAHGALPGMIQNSSDGASSFRVRDPEANQIAFVQRPSTKFEYPPSAKQVSTHLIHAGFVVKDLAAENRFYVDLLGFRLYWYGGFKDDGNDWYEIQVPDGPDWIEYMLNIPANADHKELGVQNHFSLGVKDVHAAASELRANGLKTFDGPEVGRDGKDSLDAYDPDGTRVEVMEFTPKKEPCCHPYSAPHPAPPTVAPCCLSMIRSPGGESRAASLPNQALVLSSREFSRPGSSMHFAQPGHE
jgi:catechol 2,3-dioxygenase-like lactoylglutathione lyase family enzyme